MACKPGLASLPGIQDYLLRKSVEPHVGSFDYMLEDGLPRAVQDLQPAYIELPDGKALSIWIESVEIAYPSYATNTSEPLFPRDCRLSSTTYSAPAYCRVGFQKSTFAPRSTDDPESRLGKLISAGDVRYTQKSIGRLPMMTQSLKCNIRRMLSQVTRPSKPMDDGSKADLSDDGILSPSHPQQQAYVSKLRRVLVEHGEDEMDVGGYFIINGLEKVCRMMCVPRRNFPMALRHTKYMQSGSNFSSSVVDIRCVRADQTSHSNTLHYLVTGDIVMRFLWRKHSYYLPVVLLLKCWKETTDREIYQMIVQGNYQNTFVTDRVEAMLRIWRLGERSAQIHTREECLAHVGSLFRSACTFPDRYSDAEVGEELLRRVALVHLSSDEDKFNLLVYMIQKLYSLASDEIRVDSKDSPNYQEVLLPGHLYLMVLKEKLQNWIDTMCATILRDIKAERTSADIHSDTYLKYVMDRIPDIGPKLEYFLATGNLVPQSQLQLRQTTGFSIICDRLSYLRFFSQFRAVHRGQFYLQLRTTDARKLTPDNWGFYCPVHTPDGVPCGLLNHLAAPVTVYTGFRQNPAKQQRAVVSILNKLGIIPVNSLLLSPDYITILLNGSVVGIVHRQHAKSLAHNLRILKVKAGIRHPNSEVLRWLDSTTGSIDFNSIRVTLNDSESNLYQLIQDKSSWALEDLEIVLIDPSEKQHPALILSTCPSRLRRPVFNLHLGLVEYIGTMEQSRLIIDCPDQNNHAQKGIIETPTKEKRKRSKISKPLSSCTESPPPNSIPFTHREIDPMYILSNTALLTPFSEFNQSPRNMYQCQMAKQTMGTPLHSYTSRADNKLYRLVTPQTPITCTVQQELFKDYPSGTNAIVAVISYTGYDMEDAMIICKSSYERGLGYGLIYKSEHIDLFSQGTPSENQFVFFNNMINMEKLEPSHQNLVLNHHSLDLNTPFEPSLDLDGLPFVGQLLKKGDPMYVTYDDVTRKHNVYYYHSQESCTVEDVVLIGIGKGQQNNQSLRMLQKVVIKLRIRRNPVRGDKFSSRHGQKGILSNLWPQVNMPFTSDGITPDIIINPNAFPSRMTIGMLIESMAGKSGALLGYTPDASPFGYSEDNTPTDFFGRELIKAGYNYYGNEVMYSGITGTKLHADIFIGIVYYQRLRHMVGDKYQVRTTGIRNTLTRQPVKGRKKGGGIRFGEMERDSLLAHGVAYMLHDRLFNCSDRSLWRACKFCGSLISLIRTKTSFEAEFGDENLVHFLSNNVISEILGLSSGNNVSTYWKCSLCDSKDGIVTIEIPYVFIYLLAELTAMNVKVNLDIK